MLVTKIFENKCLDIANDTLFSEAVAACWIDSDFRLQLCATRTFLVVTACAFHGGKCRKLETKRKENARVVLQFAISDSLKLRLKLEVQL